MQQRNTTIARVWREARIRSGLSVAALARRADVGTRTILRIESGRISRPRMSTVYPVSQVLGCSPVDLLPDEVAA